MTNYRHRPQSRARFADKLALYSSKARSIDGLWVGAMTKSESDPSLRRVEEALNVIKRYDPLQYMRVIRNLDRVWVSLEPNSRACFRRSLNACVLDERYVLAETTTPEMLAKTIIHEATHARLDHWGINYDDEKERVQIEAICMRRELAFAAKLPQGRLLQEEVEHTMEWCTANPEYFSNASFHQRDNEGRIEALRYLGVPEWLIQVGMKIRAAISAMRLFLRRLARPFRHAYR
jgi:hypothetical protein